jgi:hypothetical protein
MFTVFSISILHHVAALYSDINTNFLPTYYQTPPPTSVSDETPAKDIPAQTPLPASEPDDTPAKNTPTRFAFYHQPSQDTVTYHTHFQKFFDYSHMF